MAPRKAARGLTSPIAAAKTAQTGSNQPCVRVCVCVCPCVGGCCPGHKPKSPGPQVPFTPTEVPREGFPGAQLYHLPQGSPVASTLRSTPREKEEQGSTGQIDVKQVSSWPKPSSARPLLPSRNPPRSGLPTSFAQCSSSKQLAQILGLNLDVSQAVQDQLKRCLKVNSGHSPAWGQWCPHHPGAARPRQHPGRLLRLWASSPKLRADSRIIAARSAF